MTSRPRPLSELLLGFGQQIGQAIGNLGNIYTQRQMAQGQGIKEQVGEQVAQAESYLTDPSYKWDENERKAAEAFVTQGKTLLSMDDMAVPGSYAEWQQRGIKVPKTVISQGNATSPTQAQTQLTPYEGGVAGFLGDIGQGVTQATQARAEKEKDLDLLRQLRLNGQQQDFTLARDEFLHKNGMSMAEFENELGMKATQVQLDVQNSATAADRIINNLTSFISLDDPKNKAKANAIMERARGMGLQPYDLNAIETTYDSLGSGTASLNFKDRLAESGLSEQALALGDIQIKQGNQQIKLGDLMYSNEVYIQKRRPLEDGMADYTQFQGIIGEAVANGDDKQLDHLMNVLKGGGAVDPEMYQALQSGGITLGELQESYGDALKSDAYRERKNSLDMTEMELAEGQLFRADTLNDLELKSAQLAYTDQVAHVKTPAEIDAALADPKSALSMLTRAGILTESDVRSMRRNANTYRIVQQQEANAPFIEQNLKLMEALAAVPADDVAAENALRSTLGQLASYGMLQDDQVEGLVSGYRNQWTTGRATQNAELAATLQNTSYQQVLMDVQRNDLMGAAAEGDVASLSDKWDMYRESYNQQLDILREQGDAIGCGGDGISMSEEDKASCKTLSAEIGRLGQQQKAATVELVGTLGPDGEATFMQQQVARIQANIMKNPKYANASHLDIARAVNNGLQRQGLPPLNPAALDDAAARDAAENPTPEGGAQPAAAAPSRTPLQRVADVVAGATGMTRNNRATERSVAAMQQQFAPSAPSVSEQLNASGASASSGGSVAGGSTGAANIFAQRAASRPAPAASSQGATVNLRDNPAFRELTQTVSQYGALTGRERDGREGKTQDELLNQLSRETGFTRQQLLDFAKLETTASPSNPVATPLYRQRAARGQ